MLSVHVLRQGKLISESGHVWYLGILRWFRLKKRCLYSIVLIRGMLIGCQVAYYSHTWYAYSHAHGMSRGLEGNMCL